MSEEAKPLHGVAAGERNDQGSRARNLHGLTDRQERFAQALADGKTQSDAYRYAYPTCLKWPDSAVYSKSSQLANLAVVKQRVDALRDQQLQRVQAATVYNVQTAMEEALQAFEMAVKVRQPGAMVAAVQLRAKLNGLITDKKEVAVTQMGGMTPSEKDYMLQQALAEIERRRRLQAPEDVQDVVPKEDAN